MRGKVWLPLFLGVVVGAAGCGGDDGGSGKPAGDTAGRDDGGGGTGGDGTQGRPILGTDAVDGSSPIVSSPYNGGSYGGGGNGGSGGGYYKQEKCGDGRDNDGDKKVDCDDPDCASDSACQVEEICNDGIDNDGDYKVDCEDPDCAYDDACMAPVCEGDRLCFDIHREQEISFLLVDVPCPEKVESIVVTDDSGKRRGSVKYDQPSNCEKNLLGFKVEGVNARDVELCIEFDEPVSSEAVTIQVKSGLDCSIEEWGSAESCECRERYPHPN